MSLNPRRFGRYLLALVMTVTACSTDSCGCDGFEAREFPTTKLDVTIPSAGQVRVTRSGLDYVASQVPTLMAQALPGGLSFCIPPDTSGNPDLCIDSTCTGGANGCQVDLALADQRINPMAPDTLDVEITIGGVDEQLTFDYDAGLFTVNCYVQLFKKGGSEQTAASVMGTIPVRVFTDGASDTNEVGIDVGQVALDLTDVDFKIHGRGNVGDTVLCEGASLVRGLFRGRIEDEIRGALDGAVDAVKRAQLCRQCTTSADCPSSASCNSGVCDYATSCVPRTLGLEGRLELALPGLVGALGEPNPRMDVLGKAADLARVDTGVTVGLRADADPVAISDCVPVEEAERPRVPTIAASTAITGDTKPGGGAFMLGVGLHKSAIEQVLWSVWAAGATCLTISDEDVMAVTTSSFNLAAPSLKDLVDAGRSAKIAFVANEAPTVVLGTNTVMPMGDTYVVVDPLIRILWNDLDLHVLGYSQDRMVRLFTLRLDLDMPIAVVYDGTAIIPILPDLENSIANVEARRLELVSEMADQIQDAIPTFLSIAAPYIDYGLPDAVTLPEFLGFRLDMTQDDITSVQNGEFLAIYASLARTNQPLTAVANTAIIRQSISYDRVLPSGFVRPEVTLSVRGYEGSPLVHDGTYEFSWRVDRGIWSMYRRSNELVVGDAILAVQGEHEIAVRARHVGEIRSTDPTPALTVVDVEWEPAPLALAVHASESPASALPVSRLAPESAGRGQRLGCSAASGRAVSPFGLLFFLVVACRRRRRSVLILSILLVGTGCWDGCKGELRTNGDQFCLSADCIVDQTCGVDGDCAGICPAGAGGICEAGECQCVIACDPGCEADAFCCLTTKECVPYGALCGELSCDPGYEPGVTEATPNRDSCELTEFSCDCVPLPPLSIGWHGPHTSIDSDGAMTVVATYNKTYGDLMLGVVQPDAAIQWHFVDGVPAGEPIVADPMGPRGGIDERGADLGTHTAVAIDGNGRAHVFYRDEDNDVLRWGRATFAVDGTVKFDSAVLDPTAGGGFWTAAVLSGDQLHVVYAVPEAAAGSEVRHVILDATAEPAEGTPSVVLSEPTAPPSKGYPALAGTFHDLTETNGTPFLVFWNGVSDRVGRTQYAGTAWAAPSYVAGGTGPWAAGWLGADGLEHVVFMQSSGLRYSRFGDTATSLVNDGFRDLNDEYWKATIGEGAALRVENGAITVAYQDAFDRALIVSSSSDGLSNSWTHVRHRADGTGSGFWVAMTRRGANWVADMVVDRRSDPEAYVRVTSY